MRYVFTLLLILGIQPVFGQITQTERIELPFKYSDENYLMATAGDQGMILFRESKEKVSKKEVWEVLILDTSLKEKLNITVEVAYKYSILGYEYNDGYFYLLFRNDNSSKSDMCLVKVSVEDGSIEDYKMKNELVIDASHLLISESSIVLGGYINYRPTFVVFDYLNDKVQVVPSFFNSKSEVLDFNYDKKHDSYNVLMGQKNALNHNEIAIKSFDSSGKVHVDEKYEFDKNWRALNGRMIISSNNQIMVSGSYATNNSYYSQGYYFGSLVAGEALSMKYISFVEVEHFFDYMKPSRAEKIRAKIDNTQNSDKPYEFKTQAYVHELREDTGEFLLVSELYKPEFSGATPHTAVGWMHDRSYRDETGQKYVNRASKLTNTDGASHISYFETVVLGFDEKGKLLWDQSLSLNDVETLSLEQVAQVHKNGQKGVLLYKNKDELTYKYFDLDNDVVSDSTVVIDTFKEFDQSNSHTERQGRVQHWYENNFIVWGYQKINNEQPAAEVDRKRNIFFINKLLIE